MGMKIIKEKMTNDNDGRQLLQWKHGVWVGFHVASHERFSGQHVLVTRTRVVPINWVKEVNCSVRY